MLEAHSDKEWAEPNFKGFGHHPLLACLDNTDEPLAAMMRRGSAGSKTTADHIAICDEAIAALPPAYRRRVMVTCDGAGASHGLIEHLDTLARRPGYQLVYSVGWDLRERERHAIGWCRNRCGRSPSITAVRSANAAPMAPATTSAAPIASWVEQAHVTELTPPLRDGPDGDQLAGWPASMRVFARRERPHPGAQLSLFETADGWRYSLWATNQPTSWTGWRNNPAYIDAAHRVHARVEDRIRTGLLRPESHSFRLGSGAPASSTRARPLCSCAGF